MANGSANAVPFTDDPTQLPITNYHSPFIT
jgi:hypothetical protein